MFVLTRTSNKEEHVKCEPHFPLNRGWWYNGSREITFTTLISTWKEHTLSRVCEMFLEGVVQLKCACWAAVWSGSWQFVDSAHLDKLYDVEPFMVGLVVQATEIAYTDQRVGVVLESKPVDWVETAEYYSRVSTKSITMITCLSQHQARVHAL